MGINFPNSPTVGQQYPSPPVAGLPVWAWDGEKWSGGSVTLYPAYVNIPNVFTAQQSYPLIGLTDGATVNWNVAAAQKARLVLGGNRTMAAVTGLIEGTTYFLWVVQGVGSNTITWTTTGAGSFDFGAQGVPVLTTTVNQADILTFEALSMAGVLKMKFTGIAKGFA